MRGQNRAIQQTSYGLHCFPFLFAPFRGWRQLIVNSSIASSKHETQMDATKKSYG